MCVCVCVFMREMHSKEDRCSAIRKRFKCRAAEEKKACVNIEESIFKF